MSRLRARLQIACSAIAVVLIVTITPFGIDIRWPAIALAVLMLAMWLGSRIPLDIALSTERFLASRWLPYVTGLLTAAVVVFVWGSLRPVPVIHDESAYILQAKLFAAGRWAAPSPPLPEFFEQFHVLVVPKFASKYPPGHSLLMVPGIWLGLPALMPIVLSGVTGALVFALARRISSPTIGVLTWTLWLTSGANLHYRATYFSEVTSGAVLLVAWWFVLEWLEQRRAFPLILAAVAISWAGITRPLTGIAFSIPLVIVVARIAIQRRLGRSFLLALVAGCIVASIVPLWDYRTTGDWRLPPVDLYSTMYLPFDRIGFGPDERKATRSGPPELNQFDAYYREIRSRHTLAALPSILEQRLTGIAFDMWGGWRAAFLPVAVLGLFVLGAESGIALVTALLVIVAYLGYYHHPFHTRYYLEIQPVLAFLSASGLGFAVNAIGQKRGMWRDQLLRFNSTTTGMTLVLTALTPWPGYFDLTRARRNEVRHSEEAVAFREALTTLGPAKAIVFIKACRPPDIFRSLISNEPDLPKAPVWIVYDRGPDNVRLERLAPDRKLFVYDITSRTLDPLERTAP